MLRSPLCALCPEMTWLLSKWLFNLKTIASWKTGCFYSLIVDRLLQLHPCDCRIALLNQIELSFFLQQYVLLFFSEDAFFIFFLGNLNTLHFWNRHRFIFLFLLLCVTSSTYFYDAMGARWLLLLFLDFEKILVLLFLTFREGSQMRQSFIVVDFG